MSKQLFSIGCMNFLDVELKVRSGSSSGFTSDGLEVFLTGLSQVLKLPGANFTHRLLIHLSQRTLFSGHCLKISISVVFILLAMTFFILV